MGRGYLASYGIFVGLAFGNFGNLIYGVYIMLLVSAVNQRGLETDKIPCFKISSVQDLQSLFTCIRYSFSFHNK